MSKGYPAPPLTGTKVLTTTTGVVDWVNAGSGTDTLDGLAKTDGNFAVANGTAWVAESGATARASLGVAIGSDVQAFGAVLDDFNTVGQVPGNNYIAIGTAAGVLEWATGDAMRSSLGLALGSQAQDWGEELDDLINAGPVTGDSYFLVGTGVGTLAWETTTTARTSIGLGTGDTPQFTGIATGTPGFTPGGVINHFAGGTSIVDAKLTVYNEAQGGFTFFRYSTSYATLNSQIACSINTTNAAFAGNNISGGSFATDFNAIATDGTSTVRVRFGRASTTTGSKFYQFFGQGTTLEHHIAEAGDDSYLCNGGNFLAVGHNSPSYQLDVKDTVAAGFVANVENLATDSTADGLRIAVGATAANTGNLLIEFIDGTSSIGSVAGDGTGVSYNVTSDGDLKEGVSPATGSLARVRSWPVSQYTWRANGRRVDAGFVAQSLAEHRPDAVFDPTERNATRRCVTYDLVFEVDESGEDEEESRFVEHTKPIVACAHIDEIAALESRRNVRNLKHRALQRGDKGWMNWGYAPGQLVPEIAGATQELAALVDTLAGKVEQLEARIAALEA